MLRSQRPWQSPEDSQAGQPARARVGSNKSGRTHTDAVTGRLGGLQSWGYFYIRYFFMFHNGVCNQKKKMVTFPFSTSCLKIREEGWSVQLLQSRRAPWRLEGIAGPLGREGSRRTLTSHAPEGWGWGVALMTVRTRGLRNC